MKLNCIIVDDEPMARKLLQEYIEETDFLILVGTAENPIKATGLIAAQEIDLIFLDINMPKMSGMEFLRSATTLPMVIMTTAYGQFALEGFDLAVVDYLVKPFSLERFLKAVQKALELKVLRHKKSIALQESPDHFFVKCDGRIERVMYNELLYVEALANYVTLYTLTGKLVVYLTIKGLLEQLPKEQFIQVHKSAIVNIHRINAIEGNRLHVGNKSITIGASFHTVVMDRILKDTFLKR